VLTARADVCVNCLFVILLAIEGSEVAVTNGERRVEKRIGPFCPLDPVVAAS